MINDEILNILDIREFQAPTIRVRLTNTKNISLIE